MFPKRDTHIRLWDLELVNLPFHDFLAEQAFPVALYDLTLWEPVLLHSVKHRPAMCQAWHFGARVPNLVEVVLLHRRERSWRARIELDAILGAVRGIHFEAILVLCRPPDLLAKDAQNYHREFCEGVGLFILAQAMLDPPQFPRSGFIRPWCHIEVQWLSCIVRGHETFETSQA